MKRTMAWVSALITLGLVGSAVGHEPGHGGVKLGVLTCNKVPGGFNFLVRSSNPVECTFVSDAGVEYYFGEAGVALGLNLEWTSAESIIYTVLGGTDDVRLGRYALAGKYYGAKASAAVVVGGGAQILVGGGAKGFSLQPLAVEGSTGLGAAVGVGYLFLQPAH